ncbi:MAG: TetR/AcrR family transcriptional regulator [Phycisphaerae bacterium]
MISRKAEHLFDTGGLGVPRNGSSDIRVTYNDRLNHILHAATDVIARAGYEKASMRAVAKASGVSLAGLYHYFDSKEKMLFLIQFRAFGSLLNNLREKLHGVDEPIEQLRVMICAHIGYFAEHMAELKVCSHELDSLTGTSYDETRRIRRAYYELTRSIVERTAQEHSRGHAPDAHIATMSLFGMLNWLYRWYNPKRDRSPNALASQIARQFLHGLVGADETLPAGRSRSSAAPESAEARPKG